MIICLHIGVSVECLHKNKANIYLKLHTTLLRLCWIVTIKTPSFPSRNTIRHLALLSRQNTGVAVINIDRYFFLSFFPFATFFPGWECIHMSLFCYLSKREGCTSGRINFFVYPSSRRPQIASLPIVETMVLLRPNGARVSIWGQEGLFVELDVKKSYLSY